MATPRVVIKSQQVAMAEWKICSNKSPAHLFLLAPTDEPRVYGVVGVVNTFRLKDVELRQEMDNVQAKVLRAAIQTEKDGRVYSAEAWIVPNPPPFFTINKDDYPK